MRQFRRNRLTPRLLPSEPQRSLNFSASLAIAKDVLEVAWKSSPFALLPAGMFIWLYLKSIGWTGLFFESAMTIAGLTYLILAGLTLFFSAVFLGLLPTIVIVGLVEAQYARRLVPKELANMAWMGLLSWIIMYCVIVQVEFEFTPLCFLFPVLLAALYGAGKLDGLGIAIRAHAKLRDYAVAVVKLLVMAVLAAFATGVIAFGLSLIFSRMPLAASPSNIEQALAFVASLLFAGFGAIPGIAYLKMRSKHARRREPAKAIMVGVLIVFYLVLMATAYLPSTRTFFLQITGIMGTHVSTFQVLDDELAQALKAAGMQVSEDGELKFVSAFVRYQFGNTKLICLDKIDLDRATPAEARANCVPTGNGDLREFTTKAIPAASRTRPEQS